MMRTYSQVITIATTSFTLCLALCAYTSVASAQENPRAGDATAETQKPQLPKFLELGETQIIARVDGGHGTYIEWLRGSHSGANRIIGIGVEAAYPYKPALSAQFLEHHTPLEAFLAIAPREQAVPEALIVHAKSIGRLNSINSEMRDKLHRENEDLLRDFKVEGSDVPRSCSQAFKNWVGQVFGDSTCGAENSGKVAVSSKTYCISGCARPLGSVDKGACRPHLNSCDIVRGATYSYHGRLTDWNGNAWMGYWGRWQHFLAANCSGDGSIRFFRQRGSTTTSKWVAVNHAYHFFWGSWPLATAETNVTYGSWSNGLNPSGPNHKLNKAWLTHNASNNDRSILCGDIRFKRTMSDTSASSCHGSNVWLCTGGANCTSACFHCVGGSC